MTNEGSFLRGMARKWSDNKSIKPGVYNCLMTIADRIRRLAERENKHEHE